MKMRKHRSKKKNASDGISPLALSLHNEHFIRTYAVGRIGKQTYGILENLKSA
jgi:hypothetical protein